MSRKQAVMNALDRVSKEIALSNVGAGMYGRGLSREGYAGGYEQALQDVLLLLSSGCMPSTRNYWTNGAKKPKAEGNGNG